MPAALPAGSCLADYTVRMVDHRLVTGSFSQLADWLVQEVGSTLDSTGAAGITLLTGARLAGIQLRRQLEDDGVSSDYLSLQTWAEFIQSLAEVSPALPRQLARGGDDALLRQVARRIPADGYLASALDTAGLRRALLETFSELAQGGFGDARAVSATLTAVAEHSAKLPDLAHLFTAYRQALADRYADDASLISAAIENVRFGRIQPPPHLYIHGFLTIAPLGRELLSACSAGSSITLLLFDDMGDGPLDELMAFAQSLSATHITLPDMDPPTNLARVRARWLDPSQHDAPTDATEADDSLAVVGAPGGPREVRDAVGEVCAALSRGVPPQEIALLFRHGREYQQLVHEMLDAAGVPHYLPAGLPLDGTPAGRATLLLLRLVESDRRRREVLDFFHAAPLRWEPFIAAVETPDGETLAAPETSAWDRLARDARITGGAGNWQPRLRWLRDQLTTSAAQADGGTRSAAWLEAELQQLSLFEYAVDALVAHLDDLGRPRPWRMAVGHLMAVLERLLRPGDDLTAVLDAIKPLGQLAGLEPDDDPSAFFRAVSAAVGAATVRVGRFHEDVFVGDLTNMRGLSFRVVRLLGLSERAFPAPVQRDPVLDDHERRAINAVGPGRVAVRGEEAGSEELLFTLVLHAARERLVLSYPTTDSEGRPRLPSYFLLRVAEALTGHQLGPEQLHDALPGYRRVSAARLGPENPADAITPLEFDVAEVERAIAAAARTGDRVSARLGYLDRLSPGFARARAALAARMDGHLFGPHDGVFGESAARAQLAERFGLTGHSLSATAVEQYAVCPQRYFLQRILHLKLAEEPEETRRLSPVERGTLVHAILERFYRALIDEGLLPLRRESTEAYRERLHRVAHGLFEEWHGRGVTGAALVWEMDQRALLEDLDEWLLREVEDAEQSGFAPIELEVRFGSNGRSDSAPLAPARFELADGRVIAFQGVIDRIDVTADGQRFRVIDYKSGRVGGVVKPNLLQGGKALQLPVYLRAAAGVEQLGADAMGEAEYYFVTRRAGFRRVSFASTALTQRGGDIEAILRAAATGVAEGQFFAYPGPKSRNCEYCDFTSVCDSRRLALFEQKRTDPAAAAFIALEGIV